MEKTMKERIYEELRGSHPKGTPISMVEVSKKIGCSISYISSMFRHASDAGIMAVHENGNYTVKDLPGEYEIFQKMVNAQYEAYRKTVPSRGQSLSAREGKSSQRIIQKIEVTEENLVKVISSILREKKAAEDKIEKLMAYAKKIKKERDELEEALNVFLREM